MGYDITVYRVISCVITPDHHKTPCCGLRFALALSLPSSWLVVRLAFFVVLLLPIRWTHHGTDRTTSKHQLLTTRPAIWVHDCFCSVFLFYFPCLLSCYIHPKNVLDIDINTYRKSEKKSHDIPRNPDTILNTSFWTTSVSYLRVVAKKRYQAVGFPHNRMLKLSSSRGIMIDVPVLSVSWSVLDHSVIIQAP